MKLLPLSMDKVAESGQSLSDLLIKWFRSNARVLPWRTESTLYRRLVSEFMLQQTQVSTVMNYFLRWMERFPSLEALAQAEQNEVLKAWEGLGYYSRAKNLHATAKKLVEADCIPESTSAWETFPGIGHYTAAAITAIAQNKYAVVIDGNVIRVLSRVHNIQTIFPSKEKALKTIYPIAQKHVPSQNISEYSEAIMELGATICKPRRPDCNVCPIACLCLAQITKTNPETIPTFVSLKTNNTSLDRIFLVQNNSLLLHLSSQKRLKNIYELPVVHLTTKFDSKNFSLHIVKKRSIGLTQYTETIHIIKQNTPIETFFQEGILSPENLYFIPINELHKITLSGPHKRWIHEILQKTIIDNP